MFVDICMLMLFFHGLRILIYWFRSMMMVMILMTMAMTIAMMMVMMMSVL